MFILLVLSMRCLTAGCISAADGLLAGVCPDIRRHPRRTLVLFSLWAVFFLLFLLMQILFP